MLSQRKKYSPEGGENNQVWFPNIRIPAFYQIKTKIHFYNLASICSLCPMPCLLALFFPTRSHNVEKALTWHAPSTPYQHLFPDYFRKHCPGAEIWQWCLFPLPSQFQIPSLWPRHPFFPCIIRSLAHGLWCWWCKVQFSLITSGEGTLQISHLANASHGAGIPVASKHLQTSFLFIQWPAPANEDFFFLYQRIKNSLTIFPFKMTTIKITLLV